MIIGTNMVTSGSIGCWDIENYLPLGRPHLINSKQDAANPGLPMFADALAGRILPAV
jgi:hypothetical protein